jgi:nitrite reductase (NADH) small subunit
MDAELRLEGPDRPAEARGEVARASVPGGGTQAEIWIPVCALDEVLPDTGVAALVGRRQVAVVRVGAGAEVYAVSNFDPFSKAFVIARGIVGDRGGVPKIASPVLKQSFDLRTGQCLDDPSVALRTFPVRIVEGRIEICLVP